MVLKTYLGTREGGFLLRKALFIDLADTELNGEVITVMGVIKQPQCFAYVTHHVIYVSVDVDVKSSCIRIGGGGGEGNREGGFEEVEIVFTAEVTSIAN